MRKFHFRHDLRKKQRCANEEKVCAVVDRPRLIKLYEKCFKDIVYAAAERIGMSWGKSVDAKKPRPNHERIYIKFFL